VNQKHIGGDFDDFFREEKALEATEAAAIKRVIAFQVEQAMKRRKISKSEMASRMKTSRAALERLLDPANTSVTLTTLGRAASALGRHLSVELTQTDPRLSARRAIRLSAANPERRQTSRTSPSPKRSKTKRARA
jgi:transcriptional regulator with XRE-family HTH domain